MRSLIFCLALVACGGEDAAKPAAAPEPPPAPAAAPAPAPAPAAAPMGDGHAMTVEGINGAREAHIGQSVTVSGFFGSMTKQDSPAQINVAVHPDDTIAHDNKILCVMDVSKEAEIAAMTQKDPITVVGTVAKDAFFSSAMLEGCAIAPAAGAAPAAAPAPAAAAAPAPAAEPGPARTGKAGKVGGKGR